MMMVTALEWVWQAKQIAWAVSLLGACTVLL